MKQINLFVSCILCLIAITSCTTCSSVNEVKCVEGANMQELLDPLSMRWTFGAHEPYTMYRRVGAKCTGGIDGNAKWVKDYLDWVDEESPAVMNSLGLNWLHSRFYKGMGWEVEKEDLPNVKKFVSNCHKNGVKALAYVQFSTMYPEVMKNEIPHVESWQAIGMDGRPELWKPETYYRTIPCINCKEWEEYIKNICTIALTEAGFDGIMFDNAYTSYCCCERCQESFKKFLMAIPNKKDRFGFEDLSNFAIPQRFTEFNSSGEIREPLMQAWIEWRTDNLTAIFKRLRTHIKCVKPDAVVSANSPTFRNKSNAAVQGVNMVELADAYDLLIGQSEHYPSYKDGMINSRIRELKMARDLGKPIVALCDVDAKITPEQEQHYLLPLYEDLVFGGVPTDRTVITPKPIPGFIDKAKVERRKSLLASFNAFVNADRDLFTADVFAPVRLFYPEFEIQFSHSSQESLCAAEEILTRRQIPWSYMISTPEKPFVVPEGTQVIIVPGLLNLTETQVDGLVNWAKAGGRLVITGDSGRYDGYNSQYLVNPLLEKVKSLPTVVCREYPDKVNPCLLDWVNKVGAPADNGDALVRNICATGFTLPFSIENCPEYVAVDVRATEGGYILHFVNYNPATQIKGIKVRTLDGQVHKVLPFNEYNYIKI